MKFLKPLTIINTIAFSLVGLLVLYKNILEQSNDKESILLAYKIDKLPNLEIFFGTIILAAILGILYYRSKDLISKKKWIIISLIPIITFIIFFLIFSVYTTWSKK